MTHPNPMPDNPGEPEHTDPEVTSPDRAEAAAEEAASAQGGVPEDAGQAPVDPALEAEIEQALADIDSAVAGASEEEESETADVETQLAELTDDLKRISAEYANYRRRTERERQGIIDSAKSSVLIKLLPVLDDLDLAAQHGDLEAGPLKAFADKLTDSLSGMSLESFGAEGDAFDPEIHEAVQDLSNGEDKALGTILRRGYRIGDKLVRTAMVIIVDPAEQATHGDNA
ncbi:nucleotide exchange factor GrpE [Corynebacterium alimapuense]|uniref:Protein GrpE n=1 Tax=Corynebacterium alimapuense TaxID=1576874 RepID=A0A3M8K9W0_9CORY|nr:nucleotide exchange factor GrpE [Corynebacterium alimapuense]RNE49950.1 nucleotide exchange factor GrpE [Corynebacterium alimapuense]